MTERPKAATSDAIRGGRAIKWLAFGRAAFCATLAIFGLGRLVEGFQSARFEKLRYLGPANFADNALGFVAMAAFWAIAIALCSWAAYAFWRQRND